MSWQLLMNGEKAQSSFAELYFWALWNVIFLTKSTCPRTKGGLEASWSCEKLHSRSEPRSLLPAEMGEPAANTAQMLLSHNCTCSQEMGGQVLLKERQAEIPSLCYKWEKPSSEWICLCSDSTWRNMWCRTFSIYVFGLTGAKMCKLSHELLLIIYYYPSRDGKVITCTWDNTLDQM